MKATTAIYTKRNSDIDHFIIAEDNGESMDKQFTPYKKHCIASLIYDAPAYRRHPA